MTATAARMVARPQNLKYGNWPFSKFPAVSSPPLSAKMRSKHRTDGDAQSTAAKRRRALVSTQQAGFQYRRSSTLATQGTTLITIDCYNIRAVWKWYGRCLTRGEQVHKKNAEESVAARHLL